MLYIINTGNNDLDSSLYIKHTASQFSEYEKIIVDTQPTREDLITLATRFNTVSFFNTKYLVVFNKLKPDSLILDFIKSFYSAQDIIWLGTGLTPTFIKKLNKSLVNSIKATEKLNFTGIKTQIATFLRQNNFRLSNNTIIALVNTVQVNSESGYKQMYSPLKLDIIFKWLLLINTFTSVNDKTVKKYIIDNFDTSVNIWKQLDILFSKDYKKRYDYFRGLIKHFDPYELISILRSRLILLYEVKMLQSKNLTMGEIAKQLKKPPFMIKDFIYLNVDSNRIESYITKLFDIEYQIRTGERDDIKEAFLLYLLETI